MTKNNILYRYQFGFRKNFSTTLALIEVIDNLIQNMESDNISVGIYLDLQKAFDTVNHKILLAKMTYVLMLLFANNISMRLIFS